MRLTHAPRRQQGCDGQDADEHGRDGRRPGREVPPRSLSGLVEASQDALPGPRWRAADVTFEVGGQGAAEVVVVHHRLSRSRIAGRRLRVARYMRVFTAPGDMRTTLPTSSRGMSR